MSTELLKSEKTPALTLLVIATKAFSPVCYQWEPEILRHALDQRFSTEISDLQSDKLQAAIVVLTTDTYETYHGVFETCGKHFCNLSKDHDQLHPLSAEELVQSIAMATTIRHEAITYSDDVRAYAGKVFYDYGFANPPDIFPTAIMPDLGHASDDSELNTLLSGLLKDSVKHIVEVTEKLNAH